MDALVSFKIPDWLQGAEHCRLITEQYFQTDRIIKVSEDSVVMLVSLFCSYCWMVEERREQENRIFQRFLGNGWHLPFQFITPTLHVVFSFPCWDLHAPWQISFKYRMLFSIKSYNQMQKYSNEVKQSSSNSNHNLAQQFSVLMLLLMPSAAFLKTQFSKICGFAQESAWAGTSQNIKPNIINKLLVIMNNTLPPPLRRTAVLLYWKLNSVGGELSELSVPRDWRLWSPVGISVLGQPCRPPSNLWPFSGGQGSLQGGKSSSGFAFVLDG